MVEKAEDVVPDNGGTGMPIEVRAVFHSGKIELLEPLDLAEGQEILVAITERAPQRESLLEAIRATAGAWEGMVDAQGLKRRIYEDRLVSPRPEPRL